MAFADPACLGHREQQYNSNRIVCQISAEKAELPAVCVQVDRTTSSTVAQHDCAFVLTISGNLRNRKQNAGGSTGGKGCMR